MLSSSLLLCRVVDKSVTEGETEDMPSFASNDQQRVECTYDGCNRTYSTMGNLKTHMKTHQGDLPHKCPFKNCNKAFLTSYQLKNHERSHTGERPYQCDENGCDKKYSTQFRLQAHKRIHSGDTFVCKFDNCDKEFTTKSDLKKHERIHTGEKPFECPMNGCGKKFTASHHLKIHRGTHSQDKPYQCEDLGCSKQFKTKQQLTSHQRSHSNSKESEMETDEAFPTTSDQLTAISNGGDLQYRSMLPSPFSMLLENSDLTGHTSLVPSSTLGNTETSLPQAAYSVNITSLSDEIPLLPPPPPHPLSQPLPRPQTNAIDHLTPQSMDPVLSSNNLSSTFSTSELIDITGPQAQPYEASHAFSPGSSLTQPDLSHSKDPMAQARSSFLPPVPNNIPKPSSSSTEVSPEMLQGTFLAMQQLLSNGMFKQVLEKFAAELRCRCDACLPGMSTTSCCKTENDESKKTKLSESITSTEQHKTSTTEMSSQIQSSSFTLQTELHNDTQSATLPDPLSNQNQYSDQEWLYFIEDLLRSSEHPPARSTPLMTDASTQTDPSNCCKCKIELNF